MKIIIISIAAFLLFSSFGEQAFARPKKGFHDGPYLCLEIGSMQSNFDTDQTSGAKVGRDFEPSFGFLFGWNVLDSISAELQGVYSTDLNRGRREHFANANTYVKFTPIFDSLTDFDSVKILPFVKSGLSIHVAALPGNPNSGDDVVRMIGWGPSIGAGITFLINKYIYIGIDTQEDFILFNDVTQNVSGIPDTLVYKGGIHPIFSAMAILGVHY